MKDTYNLLPFQLNFSAVGCFMRVRYFNRNKIKSVQKTKNGPRQANLILTAYASSEGSGEPAHPRSLARTSAARPHKH